MKMIQESKFLCPDARTTSRLRSAADLLRMTAQGRGEPEPLLVNAAAAPGYDRVGKVGSKRQYVALAVESEFVTRSLLDTSHSETQAFVEKCEVSSNEQNQPPVEVKRSHHRLEPG
eukprot:3068532-Amphidinium_carterae.2